MKEVIEDAMKTFTGTILFVSHDRYLLDQVADHILEIKPTGVKTYIGGFQSWLDATKKEAAAANAAAQAVETGWLIPIPLQTKSSLPVLHPILSAKYPFACTFPASN